LETTDDRHVKLPEVSYERCFARRCRDNVSELAVRFTIDLLLNVVERDVDGAVAACVWKEGCSIAILLAQHERRIDAAKGLSRRRLRGGPGEGTDCPPAATWQANTELTHDDNYRVSVDEVRDAMPGVAVARRQLRDRTGPVRRQGARPCRRLSDQRVAFLRLNGDGTTRRWSASSAIELHLRDHELIRLANVVLPTRGRLNA
jgi:hypothetical protein